MTSSTYPLRGSLLSFANIKSSQFIQKTCVTEAQKCFWPYALALTALSVFVSMGFQTQAAELLKAQVDSWQSQNVTVYRNWALPLQLAFSLWVVQILPIKNFVRWLAITSAGLFLSLGTNLHGHHLGLFVLSTILGSFQTSLTWKLCCRSFPSSLQGQGAQNLCCLGGMALAGTLATSLQDFKLYVACSALVFMASLALVRPFGQILEMQGANLKGGSTKPPEKFASLNRIWKHRRAMGYPAPQILWSVGISMLYPVSMAVKGQADTYTLRVADHLGSGYASVEAGTAVLVCLFFTLRPSTYAKLARRVGDEGKLMAASGIAAALAFIASGIIVGSAMSSGNVGLIVLMYGLRAIAGMCFEIFERGSEVLSDDLCQGRKNEFAAGMLVMVLYRPAQLIAGLPMILNFNPAGCFVTSGFFLLVATLYLVQKGKLIGRAFINYAGPMES